MSQSKSNNSRAIATLIIHDVLENKHSLSTALERHITKAIERDRGLIQEISYGVLRVLPELEFYIQHLMSKVFTGKNRIVHHLMMVGIYQLRYLQTAEHAAVSETVNAAITLNKTSLKNVINGVLRSFQRTQTTLIADFEHAGNTTLHPNWLNKRIKQAYPVDYESIIAQNNQRPPMWIRVNKQFCSVSDYLKLLEQREIKTDPSLIVENAILIEPAVNVDRLPNFEQGWVSVQDLSAQKAAPLLNPQNNEIILDLCAAPGGKTTHILDLAPSSHVIAVDVDKKRTARITQNLTRLKQNATVIVGDGLTPNIWATEQFDKILLDAPCSATGVIRRHPDIKWLRQDSDISALAELQFKMLNQIWAYLKIDGILVYSTCSILPDENIQQIDNFLKQHHDAMLVEPAIQKLPQKNGGDGFFYAKLKKTL